MSFIKEEIMEFGLVAKLQEFQLNSASKVEIVNKSQASQGLNEQKDIQDLYAEDFSEIKDSQKVEKTQSQSIKQYTEVVLSNLNFGFNDASKDFFVKVTRGEAESKYPTDQMMRIKAFLMHANEVNV